VLGTGGSSGKPEKPDKLVWITKKLNFMGNEPRLAMAHSKDATLERFPGQVLPAAAKVEINAVTSFISPLMGGKCRF
jgi:hypothetical protein